MMDINTECGMTRGDGIGWFLIGLYKLAGHLKLVG